ncbi:MAG TPA: class I SAM-dependent methyltransferase [Solirubrobacterales bacterium]|nr:class I SAM-dependent methyltransferase [Solirubrobacterales bacterium]
MRGDRDFQRPKASGHLDDRRGPQRPSQRTADTSWQAGLPALSAEHRGSLLDAEADVAYRWAAPLAGDRDVLDVGCGAGHGSAILQSAGARSVTGVDHDERAVELAIRAYGERVKFARAEPAALPFAAGAFDLITCFSALESSPDADSMIGALRRLLAPGGILAVSFALEPARDPADGSALTERSEPGERERLLAEHFGHVHSYRRRVCLGSSIVPEAGASANGSESIPAEWLGSEPSEDRSLLLVAGDEEPPRLEAAATLVGGRDVRAYGETVDAWQHRARRAEADGAAKHWELVASREAQRRLRKRLWHLEHRPLRKLFRVLRGRPAKLNEGPPIRPPEREEDAWS